MNLNSLQTVQRFRVNNDFDKLKDATIDLEKGIISGVALCTVGAAKGHGVELELEFIQDIVKEGSLYQQGLKCRFGHPSMSGEALGTFLGRYHNFRVEKNKAVGDLHLDQVAKKSPSGDLYSYIVEMAAKNPDMFGASIVFSPKNYYIYNSDNEQEKVVFDDWGDIANADYKAGQPVFVKLKTLHATDLVDDPAANDEGLFSQFSSTQLHKDKFAVIASEFLKSNPQIAAFVRKNPHKILEFMKKFNAADGLPLEDEELAVGDTPTTDENPVPPNPSESNGDEEALFSRFFERIEKAYSAKFSALESRIKLLEDDPNADPTFSKPKGDKQPDKKVEYSWDREAERRK